MNRNFSAFLALGDPQDHQSDQGHQSAQEAKEKKARIDLGGWDAAFYLLLGACAFGILFGLLYVLYGKLSKKA